MITSIENNEENFLLQNSFLHCFTITITNENTKNIIFQIKLM